MSAISILLVEDSALFSSALVAVLERSKDFRVTTCPSAKFLKSVQRLASDVVVIDTVTWQSSTEELAGGIQSAAANRPVILLLRQNLLDKQAEVLRAGAVGFVGQTVTSERFSKAIKAVARGEVWFERRLFREAFLRGSPPAAPTGLKPLSDQERQIVKLVASGKTNKEIGISLGLTERTIKAHLSYLFRELGVSNRSGLVSYAILHGVVPLGRDLVG